MPGQGLSVPGLAPNIGSRVPGLHFPGGGGSPPQVVPAAPQIALTSNSSDNTPNFDFFLPRGAGDGTDAQAGDVFRIQYSADLTTWIDYVVYTLTSADIVGDSGSATTTGAIANGSYDFRARLERASVGNSSWSSLVHDNILFSQAVLTYQASSFVTSRPSTTTNFGTLTWDTTSDRVIVVLAWEDSAAANTPPSAVSLGGNTLSPIVGAFAASGEANREASDIWVSSGPLAGGSGSLSVTFADTSGNRAAAATYGVKSGTPAPNSGNAFITAFGGSVSGTVSIPSNGTALVVIAPYEQAQDSLSTTGMTVDVQPVAGIKIGRSIATSGSATIGATNIPGSTNIVMSVAIWGP